MLLKKYNHDRTVMMQVLIVLTQKSGLGMYQMLLVDQG